MSYTTKNFKSKKEVKQAIKDWAEMKSPVRCYNPGLGHDLSNFTGKVYLEGPHYPEPHKWYAEGQMIDGILVGIK